MIPVNEPLLNGNEKKYLCECIDTGWISSEGPFINKFEDGLAKQTNRSYGVAVASGTAALEIAVKALGIKEGDEVIMPTFTIISCASAVAKVGAKPILVDCDPKTWNMDVDQIEERITEETKAVMVVHIYGLPVDMDPLIRIAKKYNLKIIEDVAEVIGLEYKGEKCGRFGDISCFSFYPNKHITTGEGGMILTDDETLAKKCRFYRNICFEPSRRFVHHELGWNYRMTNLQAALGVAQLEKLNNSVRKKRYIGKKYNELLSGVPPNIQLPLPKTEYAENIYWVYGIVLNDQPADEIMLELAKRKIGTRPFFWCMHEQPVFQKMGWYKGESYPVSEKIARNGFYIPSGIAITDKQIVAVAKALNELF